MKKIIFIILLVFLVVVLIKTNQAQTVFGWSPYNIPEYPSNDIITLSASTETNNYPQIPGYNNEKSLQVNIQRVGTGWSFIAKTFSPPIMMGINTPQPHLNCNFMIKTTNNFILSTMIKYNNEWYAAGTTGISNFYFNWYLVTNYNWNKVNGGQLLMVDSIAIDTMIIYFHSYGQGADLIIDTWFNHSQNPTPKVFDGFGDIISHLEYSNTLPTNFLLEQNYPNPFNPNTKIKFTISTPSYVDLSIYNALGQKIITVVSQELIIGTYEYDFTATNLPSGNYFYTLKTDNGYKITKKMTLLK